MAWGGAVGRVIYADGGFATVLLLTDANSGVAGIVQRSRTEGMLLGRGRERLEWAYVSRFADVALGDWVVTSGLDGIFPPGYTLGHVVHVRMETSETASSEILVRPAVDFLGLEEVLVLLEPTRGYLLPSPDPRADR